MKGQGQGSNSLSGNLRVIDYESLVMSHLLTLFVASNHASAMGAGAAVPLIGSEALRFARRSARINQTRSMHTTTRQVKFLSPNLLQLILIPL